MDWAKIIFCLYLAVSNGASLNTDNSKKENLPKIEKLNSTVANLTKNVEETLEGSPSETIHFKNPVIFREREKDVSVNIKQGAGAGLVKAKNTQARSGADLKKEANEYSPVLTFTESIVPNIHGHWEVLPEVARYRVANEFESPIPIIESQSFVNKPRMTSMQINYSPQGNLEGRHFSPGYEEYPGGYSNNDDRSYQEPEKHPGRGHTVHTETTHDYGRFLPVTYKSKIEMEAEALIKKQKAQNASNSERPEQNDRDNNQRAPGYYSRYQQPVNTAFFHKGGFESAYKFPEDHRNDQRQSYEPEKYPQHTYDQRQPVTPSVEEYSYGPRQPVTSTEVYKPQYSYPPERYPSSPHQGPPNAPRQYDSSTEKYSPTYVDNVGEKFVPAYAETTPHSPRQYSSSVEQPPPQYHNTEQSVPPYPETAPHSHRQYGSSVEQPQSHYHSGEKSVPPYRETAPHSHRQYGSSVEQPPPQYHNGEKSVSLPETTPHSHRQYGSSVEQPQSHYHSGEKSVPPYRETAPHSHRQYGSSVEQSPPQYHNGEKSVSLPENTPHSHSQYGSSVEQPPPQYHNEEKFLTSYNDNLNQPPPHTEPEPKEYQRPYSNNPVIESPVSLPDPPQYTKHSDTGIPHSNEPYAKTVDDISGEKAYYSTFKSLMDLYKSIGFHFQPFSLDDIPIIQPPGFAIRNPFDTKFAVSSPLSVSSEDFHSKFNVPKYLRNTNSPHTPTVQSYDHTGRPYSDTSYSKEVNSPGRPYIRDQPVRGKYSNYPEQVPFDSNRSPVVSTEHYDAPENPRPEPNSQVESPKETFVGGEYDIKSHSSSKSVKDTPSDGIKIKGIRIKDYDSKNYFGNPSEKNVYSSAESDFNSGASPPDYPNHSHSVVRENPYNVEDHHSGEVRTTYRPRVYREKIIVEDLNPTVNSEERTHDFHSSDKRKKFHSSKEIDKSRESSRDTFGSYPISNEDQNKYSFPHSEMPMKPANKSPKSKSRSNKKSKTKQSNTKGEMPFDDQEERSNRKKKTRQNYRTPFQGDYSYSQPEQRSKHTENQESRSSKKNGKRSNKSPKKHKPSSRSQRDHMRAEGSTYHWGMERHKGTDGFFQYANVPGAKAFEYGYRMGGPDHTRERHHKTKGTHSKIKVNWEDENGDTGDHYWEFNHDSREDDGEERKPKGKPKRQSESEEK